MDKRFPNVSCSQCGREFGPGDHGFSHCENHASLPAAPAQPPEGWQWVPKEPTVTDESLDYQRGWDAGFIAGRDVLRPRQKSAPVASNGILQALSTIAHLATGIEDDSLHNEIKEQVRRACAALAAAPAQQPVAASLTDAIDIKKMVDRFLGWRLPKTFSPDCGITFKESATWPIGTNLFTADEAKAMFEYVLAEQAAQPQKPMPVHHVGEPQPFPHDAAMSLIKAGLANVRAAHKAAHLTDEQIDELVRQSLDAGRASIDMRKFAELVLSTQAAGSRDMERWLAIGKAVERACAELPEGFDLSIELERGAGTVRLYLPDTGATLDDFEADDFAGQINAAIDAALAQGENQ